MIVRITDKCNRGCNHCMLDCKSSNNNFMTVEDFKFLLSQNLSLFYTIGGGEPMLHPDIIEILETVLNRGVPITLISNGDGIGKLFELNPYHREKLNVQITNDPRYYPRNEKINKEIEEFEKHWEGVCYVETNIPTLTALGRASDKTPIGKKAAGCVNPLLLSLQSDPTKNIIENILKVGITVGKLCLLSVEPNLDITLSECGVIKLCNLKDKDYLRDFKSNIFNEDLIHCNKCKFDNMATIRATMAGDRAVFLERYNCKW